MLERPTGGPAPAVDHLRCSGDLHVMEYLQLGGTEYWGFPWAAFFFFFFNRHPMVTAPRLVCRKRARFCSGWFLSDRELRQHRGGLWSPYALKLGLTQRAGRHKRMLKTFLYANRSFVVFRFWRFFAVGSDPGDRSDSSHYWCTDGLHLPKRTGSLTCWPVSSLTHHAYGAFRCPQADSLVLNCREKGQLGWLEWCRTHAGFLPLCTGLEWWIVALFCLKEAVTMHCSNDIGVGFSFHVLQSGGGFISRVVIQLPDWCHCLKPDERKLI